MEQGRSQTVAGELHGGGDEKQTDKMYKGTRRKGEEGGGQQAEWDLGWMDWVLFPFCPVDVSMFL